MSILKYILALNDFAIVEVAHIIYIFTDWKRSDVVRSQDYPKERIILKPIALLSLEEIEKWIRYRIEAIRDCEGLSDEELPECPDEELWRRETKYAIMKEGRLKAVKLFEVEADAQAHLKTLDKKHSLVTRKGMVQRCGYCYAKPFCNQYTRMLKAGEVE
jgi:hypothetical protein